MKRIFILLLVCFCCQIYAQELTVQSFTELTNDLSARTALRLDNNDIPCALVKVELPLIGVQFDQSNQIIGNASYKVNTYWAYMPKGSKHLTISHPNFHTLDIVFADYGISYLNSATTYIVKVNVPERASQTLQPTQQYVVFNVTPADANATLELDGQSVQLTDGHGSKRMPFGTYSYKVQAVMYKTASGNITIQDPQNKHVVNISLLPNFGYVSIPNNGQNQGTEVYIDGKREGTIPFMSNRIQAGQHTIRLVNPYYQEVSETLVIEEGKTTTYNPTIIPLFGYIEVPSSSTLVGAEVYINGKYMGKTPYKSEKLYTGQYLVRVSRAQYNSAEQNLKVELGKTTTFTKQLISNFASIDLSVGKNAEIWIDDIKRGNGSWSGTLEAGAHLVECKLPNHRQTSKEIMVVANAPQTIPLETPIAIVGSLDISTNNVLEATIYLDGEVVGTTPMIIPNVIVGQHKLQIKKEGYANYEKTITIKEEDNNLNINLSLQVATKPGESKQAILQSAPTDITFEKLFTQPNMQKCNVFTSSLKEIAEETQNEISQCVFIQTNVEKYWGQNFHCRIYDCNDYRLVSIYIDGWTLSEQKEIAQRMLYELSQLGFSMPPLTSNIESKNIGMQTVGGVLFYNIKVGIYDGVLRLEYGFQYTKDLEFKAITSDSKIAATTNNSKQVANLEHTINIKSGKIQLPPNNEIWYTSTNDEKIEISKYDGQLVSSEYSQGKGIYRFKTNVTKIVREQFRNDRYATIILPPSVTHIESYGIRYCHQLRVLVLSENLQHIETDVFDGVKGDIYFLGDVPSMGWRAMWNLSGASIIYYPKNKNYSELINNFPSAPVQEAHIKMKFVPIEY